MSDDEFSKACAEDIPTDGPMLTGDPDLDAEEIELWKNPHYSGTREG